MSSGAKQIVQIAPETVIGTIPTPFARTTIPFTEISLDATVSKEDSKSILDSRLQQSSMITGAEYAGDLKVEAFYGAFDDLLAAAAFNAWSADSLTFGGTTRKTFSILRGYADVNDYHTFKGVHVNSLSVDIPETGLISMTFGLMALGRVSETTLPTGTVTQATLKPKMSNISVGDILIDGVSQAGISCLTAFSFKWDNSMQIQRCLGNGVDPKALLEALAKGSGSFTAAWSANTSAMYAKQFTNATISLVVPITDTLGNKYTLTIPKVEIKASLPTGSSTDILNTSFEYTVVEQAPTLVRLAAV